ncbi:hypothetical protein [Streptomyces sp. MP131-18]|uniref:hypothetical protein n=1 Tax=Streptomyces sp. MP131-18 TaxID=1857892 RepID=UPI0009CEDD9C|nr:hypothetical protein [Streptomyces sp. MP131-18]ONK10820.1 hypothetical protein STBA_15450 [Streptomyces sp. MP131-18]
MSEHESEKHEFLAGLVARADPGAVETRARALLEMVPMIREVGDLIAARVAAMEWRGEAAEVVRAWGDHFRQESATLSDYAERVGGAMTVAGQVLAKVKSAMPPTRPTPLGPLSDASGFEQTMAEVDRQEAIRLIDSLDSAYRLASDAMSRAPEPRFEPFTTTEGWRPPQEQASGPSTPGGAPGLGYSGSAGSAYAMFGSGEASQGFSSMPPSVAPSPPREFVGGAAAPTPIVAAPGDDWIGTSLDSAVPAPDARAPVGPTVPPTPSPVPPPAGGAENIHTPVITPQPRIGPGPGGGPGNGGALRTPHPNTQHPVPRPTMNPMSNVSSPPAHADGHHAGGGGAAQSPMTGRPPMLGFPGGRMSRETGQGGIIGGVPRQAESHHRAIPQNGIVGAGAPSAFRDLTTGAVRGPGGALVGGSASHLSDGSRPYGRAGAEPAISRKAAGSTGSPTAGITGRPSPSANGRRRKRKRNDRAQQEKDR